MLYVFCIVESRVDRAWNYLTKPGEILSPNNETGFLYAKESCFVWAKEQTIATVGYAKTDTSEHIVVFICYFKLSIIK